MARKIQRLTDNNFLVSFENDVWTESFENATSFTIIESINIKNDLLKKYDNSLLRVYTNYRLVNQK
jgi:hypothetical protein